MKRLLLLSAIVMLSFPMGQISAQENTVLDSIINANKYVFTVEDDRIIGEAAKQFLIQEARSSQFFVIGELHFNQETPVFTKAILNLLQNHGYNNYAIEIGPYSEKVISEFLSKKGGKSLLADFIKKYDPDNQSNPIAFMDALDEVEIVEQALKANYSIWGVDQEFIYAPNFLLDKIYELSSLQATNQLAFEESYRQAKQQWSHLILDSTKYRYQHILNDKTINSFFETSSVYSEESTQIIQYIRESTEIYDYYARRKGYENLHGRAQLMRTYFYDYYNRAKMKNDLPKVVVKLGSMHTTHGRSPGYVYDIGNALGEFALYHNSKAFNISVGGATYVRKNGEVIDRLQYTPEYETLYKHQAPDAFTIIDLRAIKKAAFNRVIRLNPEKDRDFLNLLMSHDTVLLTTLHAGYRQTRDYNEN